MQCLCNHNSHLEPYLTSYLNNLIQESDVEASFSSHDSDEEGGGYGVKRFKRDIAEEVFEENGNRNGASSPGTEHEMMDTAVNGGHGNDVPRDGEYIQINNLFFYLSHDFIASTLMIVSFLVN